MEGQCPFARQGYTSTDYAEGRRLLHLRGDVGGLCVGLALVYVARHRDARAQQIAEHHRYGRGYADDLGPVHDPVQVAGGGGVGNVNIVVVVLEDHPGGVQVRYQVVGVIHIEPCSISRYRALPKVDRAVVEVEPTTHPHRGVGIRLQQAVGHVQFGTGPGHCGHHRHKGFKIGIGCR